MNNKNKKIGVLDSGVGGLTLVKEMEKILPNEDIIYLGDNKNCPYGNKSTDYIVSLVHKMIDFFEHNDVKLIAVACNTISVLDTFFKDKYNIPIIGTIRSTVNYILKEDIKKVGILGTDVTIKTNYYKKLLQDKNKKITIVNEANINLATFLDAGQFDSDNIKDNIQTHMSNLLKENSLKNVVLACTHYPIIYDLFKSLYKDINFINPVLYQAFEIKDYLTKNELINDSEKNGSIKIYTTGDGGNYSKVISRLSIKKEFELNKFLII
ncbi:MAG: glutamate racemase [Oscillospiraceae bacterium]